MALPQSWNYGDISATPTPTMENHLLDAVQKLTSTLDVSGVCEAVLTGVESAFGATSSWIMLHEPERRTLRTALFRGRGADVYGSVEIPADAGVVGSFNHLFVGKNALDASEVFAEVAFEGTQELQ